MDTSPGQNTGYSDTGGDSGGIVTEQVKQGAQHVAQQTQQVASQVADKAQDQAQTMFHTQKSQATSTLSSVSQALRESGNNLQGQSSTAAQIINRAADGVDSASRYLEGHELTDLVGEGERFARRNPTVFLGGAFALGLLAARFLKSSTPDQTGYGSDSYGRYSDTDGRSYGNVGGYGGAYGTQGNYAGGYGAYPDTVQDSFSTPSDLASAGSIDYGTAPHSFQSETGSMRYDRTYDSDLQGSMAATETDLTTDEATLGDDNGPAR